MKAGARPASARGIVPAWVGAALAALLVASMALVAANQATGGKLFEISMAAVLAASAGYLLWHAPPAYALSLALFASVFSGNWSAMGLPSGMPPDHILEIVGVLMVLVRAPAVANRRVRVTSVHWVMGIAVAYVATNAWATSGHITGTFDFIDGFGVFPFLFFLVAPVAFQTAHERNILLVTLCCLGAYLGFTALLETLHVSALVYPKYILNPLIGDPAGANRARGPFAAAVQNGFGLYGCAVAAAVAVATWRGARARAVASLIGCLCLFGSFVTEQRSVWLAATVATAFILVFVPRLRVWALPAVAAGALGVILAFSFIPGLATNVNTRAADSEPVWERLNLNVAAENMIKARPVFGFGWARFASTSGPYFRQSPTYPLVYTTKIHDVYLSFGAELGIVGLALWVVVVIMGVGGALRAPPTPTLRSWRYGLIAYALFYFIVIAFVPAPTGFPPLLLWLMAGILQRDKSSVGILSTRRFMEKPIIVRRRWTEASARSHGSDPLGSGAGVDRDWARPHYVDKLRPFSGRRTHGDS